MKKIPHIQKIKASLGLTDLFAGVNLDDEFSRNPEDFSYRTYQPNRTFRLHPNSLHTLIATQKIVEGCAPTANKVFGSGDSIGLSNALSDHPRAYKIKPHGMTETIAIPISALKRMMLDIPQLNQNAIRLLAEESREQEEYIALLTNHPTVEQRLANRLVAVANKLGQDQDCGIVISGITNKFFSRIIGISPHMTAKILKSFQAKGILDSTNLHGQDSHTIDISTLPPKSTVIIDIKAIEKIARPC